MDTVPLGGGVKATQASPGPATRRSGLPLDSCSFRAFGQLTPPPAAHHLSQGHVARPIPRGYPEGACCSRASARRSPNMLNRRDWLNIAGISVLGLTVPELLRLRARTATAAPAARHKANSCVFLFLFGGPSHIDLWDM